MTDEQYEAWKRREFYGNGTNSGTKKNTNTIASNTKVSLNKSIVEGKETEYKIAIFRRVEENHRVIKQNVFTGKKYNVENSGLKVFAPWYATKEVIISKRNIDYPKKKFMTFTGTRDGKNETGILMEVDAAITVEITDPRNYEIASQNVEQELFVLLEDILRVFVAKHTPEELMNNKYNIKDIDPRNTNAIKLEEQESRLDKFEKRYGLRVSQIYFKSIELPATLKDDYEKTKIQEIENQRKRAEAEANKDVKKIETEARVDAWTKIVENLVKTGLSTDQIVDMLNTENLANSNANVIVSKGSNGVDANMIASMVAAIKQADNIKNNEVSTNKFGEQESKPRSR